MSRALLVSMAAGFLLIFAGCGDKLAFNENYAFERSHEMITLAIMLAPTEYTQLVDTLFCKIYDDSSYNQKLICPQLIRERIVSDTQLLAIANKLAAVEYTKDQIKSGVSVLETLAPEQLTYLGNSAGNADVLLFPVVFNMRDMGMVTSGLSKIRLIDLRDGAVIYEKEFDLNVEASGDQGKFFMALGLIGFSKDDYNKHFWKRLVEPEAIGL